MSWQRRKLGGTGRVLPWARSARDTSLWDRHLTCFGSHSVSPLIGAGESGYYLSANHSAGAYREIGNPR
jgi:hypothetical protein